jgi:hypothetical protein
MLYGERASNQKTPIDPETEKIKVGIYSDRKERKCFSIWKYLKRMDNEREEEFFENKNLWIFATRCRTENRGKRSRALPHQWDGPRCLFIYSLKTPFSMNLLHILHHDNLISPRMTPYTL